MRGVRSREGGVGAGSGRLPGGPETQPEGEGRPGGPGGASPIASRLPALAAAVLLLGGCVTTGDLQDVEDTMVAELRTMEAGQDSLLREMRSLRLALLDSLTSQEREALADRGEVNRRFAQLGERLARLTALVGENQRTLVELRERMIAGSGAADGGFAEDPDGADADADPGRADGAGDPGDEEPDVDGTEDPAGTDGSEDPRELYRAALQQYRRGSFATARSGLDEFLAENPEHELAPDARFYVAETYAEEDDLDRALEEYARVLQLYPGSNRAPAALFKSGRIELERGNIDDARQFFRRVVRGYPDSDEAALARDRLERLGGGG